MDEQGNLILRLEDGRRVLLTSGDVTLRTAGSAAPPDPFWCNNVETKEPKVSSMLERLSLDGKTVVITGGGTGLGLAMVRALARAGANVVIAGRRSGPIEDAAAEVEGLGREAMAIPTDVSDSTQVDRLITTTLDRFGQIDVLFNNAALVSENVRKPIWEISDEEWQTAMDVNLNGASTVPGQQPSEWRTRAGENRKRGHPASACGAAGTFTCTAAARER